MVSSWRKVMRRLRSSTFFTFNTSFFTFNTSKCFKTCVSIPALKSPRSNRHTDNDRSDRLADRLHGVQVGAVMVGVPVWIKIVVPPCKPLLVRPTFPGLLAINVCVVMQVGVFKDLFAATKDCKAVDHLRILPRGPILVQSDENLLTPSLWSATGFHPRTVSPAFRQRALPLRPERWFPRGQRAGRFFMVAPLEHLMALTKLCQAPLQPQVSAILAVPFRTRIGSA
jgi:hypothetical protein